MGGEENHALAVTDFLASLEIDPNYKEARYQLGNS